MLSVEWLKATHYTLSIFRGIFQIIRESINLLKDGAKVFKDVKIEEVSQRIEQNEISFGDYVEIRGHLSQYSHSILPHTYLFQGADRAEIVSRKPVPQSFLVEENLEARFKAMQVPVSCFPAETSTGKSICFLYPVSFNSFVYSDLSYDAECRNGTARIPFKFPDIAKPIPVIYDPKLHLNFLEKNVNLRGKIVPINDVHIQKLLVGDSREVFSRPKILGNHVANYYGISINADLANISIDKIEPAPRKAFNMFFEFSLLIENKNIDPIEIISKAIPDVSPVMRAIKYQTHNDFIMFLTLGNIRIIGRNPHSFGLYRELDASENHRRVVKSIINYYKIIHNNIASMLRGERYSIVPTFMFRNDYQTQFENSGSFHNEEILEAIKDYNTEILTLNPKIRFILK